MPSISTSPSRSLSSDAIEATRALASRERQEAHGRKKAKSITLAKPELSSEASIVASRRAEYAKAETDRLAARQYAEKATKGHKLTGVDDDGKPFDDGTPERLARALETGGLITIGGVRSVIDVFGRLRKEQVLDRTSQEMNEALHGAGVIFADHWHKAALDGAQAMDLTKDIVDGGLGNAGMPVPEHAMAYRQKVRDALAIVGQRNHSALIGVVIEGRPIYELALTIKEAPQRDPARAWVRDRLVEALHGLLGLYKIERRKAPRIQFSIGEDNMREFERRAR